MTKQLPMEERLVTRSARATDARLERITTLLSEAQIDAAREDIRSCLDDDERKTLDVQSQREFQTALSSMWAPEFRRHLVAVYTDNLMVAIDHAVYSQTDSHESLPTRLNTERNVASDARRRAGFRFATIGTLFILSNLVVIPFMAGAISRWVEHPAAIAISKLTRFLEEATGETSTPEADSKSRAADAGKHSALLAVQSASGQVGRLSDSASQLRQSLDKLKDVRDSKEATNPAETEVFKSLSAAIQELKSKLPASPKPGEQPAIKSEEALAQALLAVHWSKNALPPGHTLRNENYSDVTNDYIIVPKVSTGMGDALRRVYVALGALDEHAMYIAERKRITQSASDELAKLTTADGKAGLVKDATDSISKLGDAGRALDELVTIGPDLAKDAKAATNTLSSVSNFVLPYAFAVLAIGAMLVSIGVTSILRSLKHEDERYEEVVDLHNTLLLARLAAAVHAQGAPADALIERLAKVGERTRKGPEGGVPLPVARAVTEVARALKQG